jgi:hypothetical protein
MTGDAPGICLCKSEKKAIRFKHLQVDGEGRRVDTSGLYGIFLLHKRHLKNGAITGGLVERQIKGVATCISDKCGCLYWL